MDRFFRVLRQQSSTPSVNSTKSGGQSKTPKKHWSKSIKKKVPSSIAKGRESLLEIIYSHKTEELEKILASGVEFRALDPDGVVLIKAVELGYTDMVASLVRANVNVYDTGQGHLTPLHAAAKLGYAGIAAVLLSNGARVNELSKYERRTPLHLAVLEGHHNMVDLLLTNGADVNTPDIYAQQPLHIAARGGATGLVEKMLDAGAKIDAITNDGWTALHLAAAGGHLNVVKVLVERNASIDAQTKFGCTPLHWACKNKQTKVAIALVDVGSNLKIVDSNGKTAADCAENTELKRYLTTVQKNRKSIYFTAQPLNRLSIQLQRQSSPFAHLTDSTLSPTGRHMYTSYEDAISQCSASSPELSTGQNSTMLQESRDSIFLEVPQVHFHRTRRETDTSRSVSPSSVGSMGQNSEAVRVTADVHENKDSVEDDAKEGPKSIKDNAETARCSPETNRGSPGSERGNPISKTGSPVSKRGSPESEKGRPEVTEIKDKIVPKETTVVSKRKTDIDRHTDDAKDSELDGTRDREAVEVIATEALHHRSQSVPFIALPPKFTPHKEQDTVGDRARAATFGNIFQISHARSKPESELLHVKLFSMINRVNKSIADLEDKVSKLQLSDTLSVLSTSFENSEDESAKDTDSAYEHTETDDVTPSSSDVTRSRSDVTRPVAPPSVVLDHQPNNEHVMTDSFPEDAATKPKQRVYKRKSLPVKSSHMKAATIGARVKRNTECDSRDSLDTVSVGSQMSLKSDIQDVHDKLTGLKHTFMTESEQIAKLLMGVEEDSKC